MWKTDISGERSFMVWPTVIVRKVEDKTIIIIIIIIINSNKTTPYLDSPTPI